MHVRLTILFSLSLWLPLMLPTASGRGEDRGNEASGRSHQMNKGIKSSQRRFQIITRNRGHAMS